MLHRSMHSEVARLSELEMQMPSLGETVAALSARRLATEGVRRPEGRLVKTTDFGSNPGRLTMLAYAPPGLQAGSALVAVLHGCTQSAEAYASGAGWLELADRYGFAVLCPEQQRSNNPNLCFNWFSPEDTVRGGGEAASIQEMIQVMLAEHGLDPGSVFITGLSAGGAMANVMLAAYPELFAGGAIIAGLPYGSASNVAEAFQAMGGKARPPSRGWGEAVRAEASAHQGPWPKVSVWQGDDDHTVRPEVADQVAAQWVEVHGAAPDARAEIDAKRRIQRWRTPDRTAVVELHRLAGMGHSAPVNCSGAEGCGAAGPFLLDVGLSSSLELVRLWGLDRKGRSADRGDAPPPPDASTKKDQRPMTRAVALGDVINSALRTAGLMR